MNKKGEVVAAVTIVVVALLLSLGTYTYFSSKGLVQLEPKPTAHYGLPEEATLTGTNVYCSVNLALFRDNTLLIKAGKYVQNKGFPNTINGLFDFCTGDQYCVNKRSGIKVPGKGGCPADTIEGDRWLFFFHSSVRICSCSPAGICKNKPAKQWYIRDWCGECNLVDGPKLSGGNPLSYKSAGECCKTGAGPLEYCDWVPIPEP